MSNGKVENNFFYGQLRCLECEEGFCLPDLTTLQQWRL